ncbi:chorismate mutase [Phaeacidiphilus oryzae]|uniref:chorismate mutase n=1 Tax=Phaeacidiphilus oryzae TaxID=348818 RepID=UPI0009FCB70D|nr:chorismate mutase [Phaeacidiphilus oryzae]
MSTELVPTQPNARPETGVRAEAPDAAAAEALIAQARERIDALDGELLRIVKERMAVSARVQRARIATGGPRLSLAREQQILARFHAELGRAGTELGMLLLELSRGRA